MKTIYNLKWTKKGTTCTKILHRIFLNMETIFYFNTPENMLMDYLYTGHIFILKRSLNNNFT